jgi:bifunctional non-homologous end joining protein LigD
MFGWLARFPINARAREGAASFARRRAGYLELLAARSGAEGDSRFPATAITCQRMLWRNSSPRFRRNPPTGFILPCKPTRVDRPPAGPDWLHEVKHDGYRVLALKRNGRVRLWSRRGTDLTHKLTRIAATVRDLPADEALIDGEAVVLRADGRIDFEALLTKRGGESAAYVAFDLLSLDGQDFRPQRLEDRRTALKRLVDGADGVLFSDAIKAEGAIVFVKACELGLEGIVSKRSGSRYSSGAGRQWLKCKNPDFQRT